MTQTELSAQDAFNKALEEKDFDTAEQICARESQKYPDSAVWLTARGNLDFSNGRYEAAERAYRRVLRLTPDEPTALCNLTGVLYETARYDEALACANAVLSQDENNTTALLHKGNVLNALNDDDGALACYEAVEKIEKNNTAAIANQAYVYAKKGQTARAEKIYAALLKDEPDNVEWLSALASAQEQNGDALACAQTYFKILQIQPSTAWHITFGGAVYGLRAKGNEKEAARLTDAWLTAFPDNPIALHTLQTLAQNDTESRASEAYVRELFDTFADCFDSVLADLRYAAPQYVADALKNRDGYFSAALDLGCGTGLCGKAMTDAGVRFQTLTGVDLSEKMMEKAAERGVYTHFENADIVAYLQTQKDAFDAIVSSDVFTYLGDLSALFAGAARALRTNGAFVFTVSANEENSQSFKLTPSGRYVHGAAYLEKSLKSEGFDVESVQNAVLRYEMGEAVNGYLIEAVKRERS